MEREILHTQVVIIGAGPSGLSASMFLSKHKIHHVLLERTEFPRDKICGDALSGKVTSLLRDINPDFLNDLQSNGRFESSWGVIFSSPAGREVAIPFKHKPAAGSPSPGYIAERLHFDAFLAEKSASEFQTLLENEKVEEVQISGREAIIESSNYILYSDIVLGADGTSNILGKQFLNYKLDKNHYCAGLRQYFTGVSGLHPEGYIELHFVEQALPGYFWIFPLPGGKANVGIGMLSKYVSKYKIDLKQLLEKVMASEKFSGRFKNAQAMEKPKGWGLPLGAKRRPLSGERFMVLGDAASLIDPFTGEGIGNGMISGRLAAEFCVELLEGGSFNASEMKAYDDKVYAKLGGELSLSKILQKLIQYPWLFNWIIRKIERNEELKKTITFMFEDVQLRKQFTKPSFYLRLLFS